MRDVRELMRNGLLVNALRLMDICEEEGTGCDVVIEACEEAHLRSPEARTDELDGTEDTSSPGRRDHITQYHLGITAMPCLFCRMRSCRLPFLALWV